MTFCCALTTRQIIAPVAGLDLVLLTEGAFKWHIDLDRSFVISDKWQDAQAAHVAGCTSMLIRSPWIGSGHHDFVVPDLATAAAKILHLQNPKSAPSEERKAVRI